MLMRLKEVELKSVCFLDIDNGCMVRDVFARLLAHVLVSVRPFFQIEGVLPVSIIQQLMSYAFSEQTRNSFFMESYI